MACRSSRPIQGGGKGKLRYTVAEATKAKRTIEAQVIQNGLPRTNIVVARYSAANPKVGRPAKVRAKRKGSKVVVTWGAAPLAARYETTISTSFGQHLFFPTGAKQRRVVVPRIAKRERVRVKVVAISASQRRGPAGRAKLTVKKKTQVVWRGVSTPASSQPTPQRLAAIREQLQLLSDYL